MTLEEFSASLYDELMTVPETYDYVSLEKIKEIHSAILKLIERLKEFVRHHSFENVKEEIYFF